MMMQNILLIEPDYKNKYPPLGLMKIATYYKILGDNVVFVKGKNQHYVKHKWNKVFITTLFTFFWKKTIQTIDFYKNINCNNIEIGGILASLMPNEVNRETNLHCHIGPYKGNISLLLEKIDENNDKNLLMLKDEIVKYGVDILPPDYGIFDGIENLPYKDFIDENYILRTSQGCYRKCSFCAVNNLIPSYNHRIKIIPVINYIKERWGEKKNLILLDDNLLFSDEFETIIDDIKQLGFTKDAKLGKKKRFVDYNQGIDLRLLDLKKLIKLREIELKPLRVAYDNSKLEDKYVEIIGNAVKIGFREISSYLLFNYDDDPADLYRRMKVSNDLNNKLNCRLYSFPMKYIPNNSKDRSFIGKYWTRRQIRSFQCILNSTHGIVPVKKEFFQNAFGKSEQEFLWILNMPENYIINRNKPMMKEKISKWKDEFCDFSGNDQQIIKAAIANGKNRLTFSDNQKINFFLQYHYINESIWSMNNESY